MKPSALLMAVCVLLGTATVARPPAASAAAALTFAPRVVPAGARPYNDEAVFPRKLVGVVDGTGVRMFVRRATTGGRKVNHPVAQAQYGLSLLNSYRLTHDAWYLTYAARQGKRLIDTRVAARGAWWYPYPFDFPLGSNLNMTMRRPWYSAMAQGQALSLFVRLHQATGNAYWKVAADRTFASLRLGYAAGTPWVIHTDGNRKLWLEEYPGPTPATSCRVLNGHLFALYGVWDYWFLTRSAAAASLFNQAALTTHRYVLNNFRNRGWASSYGLRGDAPTEKYHVIHVNQLLHLHALAGAPVFATMAEVLQEDFSAPAVRATVTFAAAPHTGVRFLSTSNGAVTGRKLVRLNASSTAPVGMRRRILGQPGYWYRISAGVLAGYWVQEVPRIRATRRPVSTAAYFAIRSVRMAPGTYTLLTPGKTRTVRLTAAASARVSAFGWIDGRRAVLISAGSSSGWWLPLGVGTTMR
ncbi:D-glucuronyl C5-epimerase family protein [Actinoplanes sp. NBRC 103695]|uniref:D-glucuronyl C5-epimerase family protein n=1 Tax=Actinoplanes sp. NBRC 103695 TaxID=3032202 RepID=UPI0024A3D127|nr:D-glucuronyl C5-epimerase family protein [Actinoplanes sp. NBRC 103695]GLY97746.1 hypothetical protein Acsp02_50000 [Actinoplanes sp. NBRC 103695]